MSVYLCGIQKMLTLKKYKSSYDNLSEVLTIFKEHQGSFTKKEIYSLSRKIATVITDPYFKCTLEQFEEITDLFDIMICQGYLCKLISLSPDDPKIFGKMSCTYDRRWSVYLRKGIRNGFQKCNNYELMKSHCMYGTFWTANDLANDLKNYQKCVEGGFWNEENLCQMLVCRNSRDRSRDTLALINTTVVQILQDMVKRGVDIKKIISTQHAPSNLLHFAAQSGLVDVVKYLLDYGFDPCVNGARETTTLAFAKQSGKPEVVKLIEDAISGSAETTEVDSTSTEDAPASTTTSVKPVTEKGTRNEYIWFRLNNADKTLTVRSVSDKYGYEELRYEPSEYKISMSKRRVDIVWHGEKRFCIFS